MLPSNRSKLPRRFEGGTASQQQALTLTHGQHFVEPTGCLASDTARDHPATRREVDLKADPTIPRVVCKR